MPKEGKNYEKEMTRKRRRACIMVGNIMRKWQFNWGRKRDDKNIEKNYTGMSNLFFSLVKKHKEGPYQ